VPAAAVYRRKIINNKNWFVLRKIRGVESEIGDGDLTRAAAGSFLQT
jgi:hypothetical protein